MKTVLNTRIDAKVKSELEVLSKQMGLSLSALVSAALTKVAKEKKLELSGLTENGFTVEYEESILNDSDNEVAVSMKNQQDFDNVFNGMMKDDSVKSL